MSTWTALSAAAIDTLAGMPTEITDAPAAPPQGVEATVSTLLGWGKWVAFVCGVAGIIASGVMMMIGRRNRSQMSVDGATGLPWVIGGLSCVVLAVPVVNNLFA